MKALALLPIIIGLSLNVYSKRIELSKKSNADPIASAGSDVTIYLTQTSTATLDGSASSGNSYQWREISTDCSSRATINNATSKVTTVSNLPQGTYYFEIAATTSGTTKRDTMVVRVDVEPAPAFGTLHRVFNMDSKPVVDCINWRGDTTTYFLTNNAMHSQLQDGSQRWNLYRDRVNGIEIDSLRGKLRTRIEDGYGGSYRDNGGGNINYYARSELQIDDPDYFVDTNKIYMYEWKGYFPSQTNYLPGPNNGLTCIFQIHTNSVTGQNFTDFSLKGDNNIVFTIFPNGAKTQKINVGTFEDWTNKTHTIRLTVREGYGHGNMPAFFKLDVDGVQTILVDTGQVGGTEAGDFQDYAKFGTLYDAGNSMVDPTQLSRGRKFDLITESFKQYVMSAVPPLTDAGKNQIVTLPSNSATLSGKATAVGTTISGVTWTKISGSSATITNPNSLTTTVTGLSEGVYVFNLHTVDANGLSNDQTTQVIVEPKRTIDATGYNYDVIVDGVLNGTVSSLRNHDLDWSGFSFFEKGFSTNSTPLPLVDGLPNDGKLISTTNTLYQFQPYNQKNALWLASGQSGTLSLTTPGKFEKIKVALTSGSATVNYQVNYSDGSHDNGSMKVRDWACNGCGSYVVTHLGRINTNGLLETDYWGIYEDSILINSNKTVNTITFSPSGAWLAVFALTSSSPAKTNLLPVANAGNDQSINLPANSITLSGSAVDIDGSIASYQWAKISGPNSGTINNANSSSATANNLVEGNYQFELTVTDNNGGSGKDTTTIIVNPTPNLLPKINAGSDEKITLPVNTVTLYGNATDEDGTIASVEWSKISGPNPGQIDNPNSATTTVSELIAGIYIFKLTAIDNKGATADDTVSVIVNAAANIPPSALAGSDQNLILPANSVLLAGEGSDEDGTIEKYSWTKISGPASGSIENPLSPATNVSDLSEGIYQFELTVTDNAGAVATDTVAITIDPPKNIKPVADAGTDQALILPIKNSILYGSGNDQDGTIISYLWQQISGPSQINIENKDSAITKISTFLEGIYQFELTVIDNKGDVGNDTINIIVSPAINIAPIADAGADQTITLPKNNTLLSGNGIDQDGTIEKYSWAQIAGPAIDSIENPSSSSTNISGLSEGSYLFELSVSDNNGAIGKDTVTVTVLASKNTAPKAEAGANQTILLPNQNTILYGSGTDEDGIIEKYHWVQISGPSGIQIENSDSSYTNVNGLLQGTYQFELTVTDDMNSIGKDTVTIQVNSLINIAPVADAGADQEITLPVNNILVSGIGSDEDGTISGYSWKQIAGSQNAVIEDSLSATSKISNLTEGAYQFELTVTDNNGAVTKDSVEIVVKPAINIAPVADAGINQIITLPANSTILNGKGTDEDGNIANYEWKQLSGPGNVDFDNAKDSVANISGLLHGIYQFELKVTDDKGAFGTDTLLVQVNVANNIAPTADAGSDQSIELPVKKITLVGLGKDSDGTIAGYTWKKIFGSASGTILNPYSSNTDVDGLEEGIYQFELTVTDDKGDTGKDTVLITVNPVKNNAPLANAGGDQSIKLPLDNVNLSGTATDSDGTIVNAAWVKISGPADGNIETPNSLGTKVSGLSKGTYQFELTVTDNKGAIVKDTVEIKVNPADNILPVANAGADQSITLPKSGLILFGGGKDEDGYITSFAWAKISGPGGEKIVYPNSGYTIITSLQEGTYQFELTVTDNKAAIAKDTMQIIVNPAENRAPAADAGSDQIITLPVNSTNLLGNGYDIDGTIASYKWEKISGPSQFVIENNTSSSTRIKELTEGDYELELTVTDDKGAIGKDTMMITVNPAKNINPSVSAGSDQEITLPKNGVVLIGTATDPDGAISKYSWTKISGPVAENINTADSVLTVVNGLTEGTYQFELTVTDNKGAVAKDTVQVKVNEAINIPPTANAGSNKLITLPINSVTLSGNGTDADGSIVSYKWTKISGPNSGVLNNANSGSATVVNLLEGTYEFELKVTDNKGAVAKDTMQVKVNEAINIPPTANAGSDKSITFPINSVTLSGSGADKDGSIVSYQWTKISGPSSGAINNANSTSATATNLTEGTYQFELKVTDNKGTVAKDTMQVKVNEAINIPPTANAGSDKSITLPTNSVALSGSGSDSDGTIDSYSWVKISGPSNFSLNNSSSASANATGLVQGTYEFELTVKDNKGAIGKDVVKVVVNKAPNLAPSANAGSDQSVTLPANSVTLSGSGADKDGSIVSYQWAKISGPNSGAINNANSASATVTNLVEGNYQFVLTAQDNEGAIAKDTVKVIVNPKAEAPVIAPTASAGKDTTILYPASTVTLAGTATKGSAEIVSYTWKQLSGPSESVINAAGKSTVGFSDLKEGTYEFEFQVKDKNGAIGRDSVKVTVALGRLAPQVNDTISVYPNPVHDITTADINTGRINTNVLITVTDISGKTIYKKQMLSTTENIKEQINMSNLTNGTYIITIFFDNVLRKSIKVVKL